MQLQFPSAVTRFEQQFSCPVSEHTEETQWLLACALCDNTF